LKLYLHIGSTKTGSTAVQSYLHVNRAALLRQGVLYPETFLDGVAHHKLATLLQSDSSSSVDDFAKLKQEITASTAHTVILSTESLFFLQSRIDELAEQLNDFDVYPVVYLRRQDVWFEAMYTQTIKHEEYRFSGNIRDDQFLDMYHYYMKYDNILENWQQHFNNQIEVKLYETHPHRLNVVDDFIEDVVGIDRSNLVAPMYTQSSNTSLSHSAIRFLKCANSISADKSNHNKLVDELSLYTTLTEDKKKSYSFLTDFEKKSVIKRYAANNRNIARTYCVGNSETLFNVDDCTDSLSLPENELDNESLAKLIFWTQLSNEQVTDNPNHAKESPLAKWQNQNAGNVYFSVPSTLGDVRYLDSEAEVSTGNIHVNIINGLSYDLPDQTLTVVRNFDSSDPADDLTDFHKSLNTLLAYNTNALVETTKVHGCSYVVQKELALRQLDCLDENQQNHIIISARYLDDSTSNQIDNILRDSNYSQYINSYLENNGLKYGSLIPSAKVVGIHNAMISTLVSNWTSRTTWIMQSYPDIHSKLDVGQVLDACFSMAIVDSGLHVRQIC